MKNLPFSYFPKIGISKDTVLANILVFNPSYYFEKSHFY